MSGEDLQSFRAKRLDALVDKLGSNNELGRRLGLSNGTYIGQMRRGERPITEKFIAKVTEKIRGTAGWFDMPADPLPPTTTLAEEAPVYSSDSEKVHDGILLLGRQIEGLDEYRRNAVGQLLLGLAKNPKDAKGIAADIQALLVSRVKAAA